MRYTDSVMSIHNPHLITGQFINPKQVVTHFHLREGDTVGDLGAGVGNFTIHLAKAAGASGKVYALEIQKSLVTALGDNARNHGLTNVDVLWCDMEAQGGTKLEADVLNVGVIVNTLFQIENKIGFATETKRILRSGAKLFIIDWTHSFRGMGPQAEHVVNEQSARALFEEQGFTFERTFPAGAQHYGLALRL